MDPVSRVTISNVIGLKTSYRVKTLVQRLPSSVVGVSVGNVQVQVIHIHSVRSKNLISYAPTSIMIVRTSGG